jgi:[acyl-carrier-protein] S-malonyltransferase
MEREEIETLCEDASEGDVLSPANFNCPGQTVIAGHAKAVRRAIDQVEAKGKRAILLPVSAPFHSPLMKPAGIRLEQELEHIAVNDLKIPVVTNVEAEPNTSKDRVKSLLVTQVTHRSVGGLVEDDPRGIAVIGSPGNGSTVTWKQRTKDIQV